MTRTTLLLTIAAVVTGCSSGPGPWVTEPMPDIPETVEYDTVRIEYGDNDLLGASSSPTMLVGDPSGIASIAQAYVRTTNLIIRTHIALIDAITRGFPTDYGDGVWSWDNARDRRNDELFSRFAIRQIDDEDFTYQWLVGTTEDEMLEVFAGEFRPRARFNGRQRGLGILRFNFDNLHAVNPDSTPSQGRAAIAFRSIGGVRQVHVASFDVVQAGGIVPASGQYQYVQFADAAGRFQFAAETDFLSDGAPLEELNIDTVWARSQAGRAMASLTAGSLEVNEVLLEECWDDAGRTTFADATPDLMFPYEDGDASSCDERVVDFPLDPPQLAIPQADPEIPAQHPDEEEEIIVEDP